jgi:hypothetical protein
MDQTRRQYTPRDLYRIHGLQPEIADQLLSEETVRGVSPFEQIGGVTRQAGDFMYTDDDLQRLLDLEAGDNRVSTNVYRHAMDYGLDPVQAANASELASWTPGLGSLVAAEDVRNAGGAFLTNYEQGRYGSAALDAGSAGLSLIDAIAMGIPVYNPIRRGTTGLIDMAMSAARGKR